MISEEYCLKSLFLKLSTGKSSGKIIFLSQFLKAAIETTLFFMFVPMDLIV